MHPQETTIDKPRDININSLRVLEIQHELKYIRNNLNVTSIHAPTNQLKHGLVSSLYHILEDIYLNNTREVYHNALSEIAHLCTLKRSGPVYTHYIWRDNRPYKISVRTQKTPILQSTPTSMNRGVQRVVGIPGVRSDGTFGPRAQLGTAGGKAQGNDDYISFKNLKFESSIYYDPVTRIASPRIGNESRYGRSTISIPFILTEEQAQQLKEKPKDENSPDKLLYLFMCTLDAANSSEVDQATRAKLEYPYNLDIRINGKVFDMQSHNKSQSANQSDPIDITPLINSDFKGYNNVIISYSYPKRVIAMIQMVSKYKLGAIIEKLKITQYISENVVRKKFKKAVEDDDLVATGDIISVKCPLSQCRIKVPIRSKNCTHTQCFDANSFIGMSKIMKKMQCPVCSQTIASIKDIVVDGYFENIIKNTADTIDRVKIDVNGDWSPEEIKADCVINSDQSDTDDNDSDSDVKIESKKRKREDSSVSEYTSQSNVVDLTLDSDDDSDTDVQSVVVGTPSRSASNNNSNNTATTPNRSQSQPRQVNGLLLPPRAAQVYRAPNNNSNNNSNSAPSLPTSTSAIPSMHSSSPQALPVVPSNIAGPNGQQQPRAVVNSNVYVTPRISPGSRTRQATLSHMCTPQSAPPNRAAIPTSQSSTDQQALNAFNTNMANNWTTEAATPTTRVSNPANSSPINCSPVAPSPDSNQASPVSRAQLHQNHSSPSLQHQRRDKATQSSINAPPRASNYNGNQRLNTQT